MNILYNVYLVVYVYEDFEYNYLKYWCQHWNIGQFPWLRFMGINRGRLPRLGNQHGQQRDNSNKSRCRFELCLSLGTSSMLSVLLLLLLAQLNLQRDSSMVLILFRFRLEYQTMTVQDTGYFRVFHLWKGVHQDLKQGCSSNTAIFSISG